MGKREDLLGELQPLLADGAEPAGLEWFLVSHSNLPGPRGNLELASAFADALEAVGTGEARWELLLGWADLGARDAPTGDPREFLPFCALQALGALYSKAGEGARGRIVEILKTSAGDPRWRVREGVAMGFQRIGERDFPAIRSIFSDWMAGASLMDRRAMVAALAHPPMLKDPDDVRFCLSITGRILEELRTLDGATRKGEDFRVLRLGLEYAPSVFVERLPGEGFAFLKAWARVGDADVGRIVKSNLGKARLAKKYPGQVEEALALLQSG